MFLKPQICSNLIPVKKKLLSRTWHAGLLTFQVNENGCYRKVIVFVLFLCILFFFYISWATKVLQKWKTVSLFKVIFKTKITWSKRCWLILKNLWKQFLLWMFIIVLWSLKCDYYIKSKIKKKIKIIIISFSSFIFAIKV